MGKLIKLKANKEEKVRRKAAPRITKTKREEENRNSQIARDRERFAEDARV